MRKGTKGRGAQLKLHNRFEKRTYSFEYFQQEELSARTRYIETHAKTILNKVVSDDLPMDYSSNPYQGCEHGCIYCYARTTHEYWGVGAGIDFERQIFVKMNAADLLRKAFESKKWKAASVMLSGNTDCYQPVEQELEITRSMLEVFREYRNPVGILTKNSLIERDIDILKDLNEHNLVKVAMSITTLKEELRRIMEPRTSSVQRKLGTIRKLTEAGISTTIIIGPVIPGINLGEVPEIIKETAHAGANWAGYTTPHLNGPVAQLFDDWLQLNFPDRREKVLNQIKEINQGMLGLEQGSGKPETGGELARMISQLVDFNRRKYMNRVDRPYNFGAFKRKGMQMNLFPEEPEERFGQPMNDV